MSALRRKGNRKLIRFVDKANLLRQPVLSKTTQENSSVTQRTELDGTSFATTKPYFLFKKNKGLLVFVNYSSLSQQALEEKKTKHASK